MSPGRWAVLGDLSYMCSPICCWVHTGSLGGYSASSSPDPQGGSHAQWTGLDTPQQHLGTQQEVSELRSQGRTRPHTGLWYGTCSLHRQLCLWASVSLSVKWGHQFLWQHRGWLGNRFVNVSKAALSCFCMQSRLLWMHLRCKLLGDSAIPQP